MTQRSQIDASFLPAPGSAAVEWRIEPGLTPYDDALAVMEARAAAIRDGTRRRDWSGWSSTRRSTPPAPARAPTT